MLRAITWCLGLAILLAVQQGSVSAATSSGGPSAPTRLTFSDGAVATPFDHCGEGDLCATITYPDGDTMSLYSEGAAHCQAYQVHFVRVHDGKTLFEFSRSLSYDSGAPHCGRTDTTQMTFDHGLVHLVIVEYSDGTLRFDFKAIT